MAESKSEKPDSYEGAVERLEEIIDRLDSGQAGLRETLELCREGRDLVGFCAEELDAVGEGLKELRLDELAAKLAAQLRPGWTPLPMPCSSILIAGSVTLVGSLTENDLVDELRLMVFPVMIGGGKRPFPEDREKRPFRLIGSSTFDSGVAVHSYEPA
jgi:exodeoxyribonuclease VII small subunit